MIKQMKVNKLFFLLLLITCIIALSSCGEKMLKVPFNAEYYIGQNYLDVVGTLHDAGFNDITFTEIDDLTSNSSIEDGYVESVVINNSNNFSKKDRFPLDAKVEIIYHIIPRLNPPISSDDIQNESYVDIGILFTEAGFTNVTVSDTYDLDPDETSTSFINEITINGYPTFSKDDNVPFDSNINIVCHYPYTKYSVNVSIEFIPNLIFSKYDVDFSVNGFKYSTIEHGQDADFKLRLKKGEVKFLFAKEDNASVNGSTTLMVDDDVDVKYKIYCYHDKVTVDTLLIDYKSKLSDNEAKINFSKYTLVGHNYKEVVATLEELGFTNIKTVPVYDIVLGITEEESTASITIDGKDDYINGNVFKKDVEIVVTYHLKEEDDPAKKPTDTTPPSAVEIITIDNNEDFAAILTAEYLDTDAQADFVKKYNGKIVEFDCIVYYLEQNPQYSTIYSFVLAPGTTDKISGASLFIIENVSFPAFKWDSTTRPEYLTVGSKIRIRAKITYGTDPLYIYLTPVKTWGR